MGSAAAPSDGPPPRRLFDYAVYRSSPVDTSRITRVDVLAITTARAVINIRERRVEVGVWFNQVGHPVDGEVLIYVVDVNPVAEHVIGEHVARLVMRRAAFFSRAHHA